LVALASRMVAEVTQVAALANGWMETGLPETPAWVRTLPLVGTRLEAY